MDKAQAAYDWLAPKLSSIERESLDSIMAAIAALREENAWKDALLREWVCKLAPLAACDPLLWTTDALARDYAKLAEKTIAAQAPEAKGESGEAAARAEAQRIADEYSEFITPVVMADLLRGDIQRALLARPAPAQGEEAADRIIIKRAIQYIEGTSDMTRNPEKADLLSALRALLARKDQPSTK